MKIFNFKSELFKPYLPEECQVNPNIYGFEFCHWLSREMAQRNIYTSYPEFEDWGWFLEISDGEKELWICCMGELENDEYFWKYYIKEHKSFWGKRKWTDTEITEIENKISDILLNSNIKVAVDED